MMVKSLIVISLFVWGISFGQQINGNTDINSKSEGFSKGCILSNIHTLTIHIKDPAIHDSVFHFLMDQLQLPVYYHPVSLGERKYAGIFAGNLVLEPCGPYTQFSYATDFRAIFFGLNFETDDSISSVAKVLDRFNIKYKIDGEENIYPQDPDLVGENTFIGISNRHGKGRDHARMDSLKLAMNGNYTDGLGIEYVKEIRIGYRGDAQLQLWKELIFPSELNRRGIWKTENGLQMRFIQSSIKEVKAIMFKVKSLEKAKQYLVSNQLTFTTNGREIMLEPKKAFGLTIYFSE